MAKKVTMGAKPERRLPAITPDQWVAGASPPEEEPLKKAKVATTRFTIDIPTELHAQIKIKCALKRVKMRDEILMLLEKHFGE
jgi:hypothetical protein